jgi:hypothetical protein
LAIIICAWRDLGDDKSKQRDQILNISQSPSNIESTLEGIGKALEDIEAVDAGDL